MAKANRVWVVVDKQTNNPIEYQFSILLAFTSKEDATSYANYYSVRDMKKYRVRPYYAKEDK